MMKRLINRWIPVALFLCIGSPLSTAAPQNIPKPVIQTEVMVVDRVEQLPGGTTGVNSGLQNTVLLAKVDGQIYLRLYDDQGRMAAEISPNQSASLSEQNSELLSQIELDDLKESQRELLLSAFVEIPETDGQVDQTTSTNTLPEPPSAEALRAMMPMLFPIHTQGLTPGPVATHQTMHQGFIRPVFVVGNDIDSKLWLRTHREKLMAANAIGWIVEAEDEQDWIELMELSGGLTLLPADGSVLKEALNLDHYPVLISRGWIEQ